MTIGTLVLFTLAAAAAETPTEDPQEAVAYPVSEIIELGPTEPQDPVLRNLELIQEQNARLAEQVSELRKRLDERTEPKHERLLELGTGFAFRGGDVGRFMLEGNLSFVNAYLILPGGWGVGFAPTIEAWRFRIRPIGVGVLCYFDRHAPLVVRKIPRDWDFMVSTAADFLVWQGLQVRFQVFWAIPNPGDVTSYAARQASRHWEELKDEVDRNAKDAERERSVRGADEAWERTKDDVDRFAGNVEKDGDIMNQAYKRAGKLPYFLIGLRWEF